MKVLVIGHPEAVLGFSLAGVLGQAVSTADEANKVLDEALGAKDIGIILVTQDIAALIQSRMDHSCGTSFSWAFRKRPIPGHPVT